MSDVLAKVEEHMQAATGLDAELEAKPLSQAMREATWGSHEQAEFSPFEQALVKGTIIKDAYADLMAQTLSVYEALEEVALQVADHPVAGRLIFPELTRVPAIEADLAFYYGEDWRAQLDILPVTVEYTERIKKVAATDTVRYIAHHYTRYLADLSGGFVIDKGIQRAFGLEEDGRRFYQFDQIEDAKAFKINYRDTLDGLPIAIDEKRALVEEVLVAYQFNISMIAELSARHDPFEVGGGAA